MGQAAKRKKQRPRINGKPEFATKKSSEQLPTNLDDRHRLAVESLWNLPEMAELLDKVKHLPKVEYSLSSSALALFQAFEKLAASRYQLEGDRIQQQAWADAPAVALKIAMTLHVINYVAVGDVVPTVICEKSLSHGIQLAHCDLTSAPRINSDIMVKP